VSVPEQQPSQRGPILVFVILIAVLVVLLGALLLVGQRLVSDYLAENRTRDAVPDRSAPDTPDDTSSKQGTVRFQLVTAERVPSRGSCPKSWKKHEQQCLRLGEGFPANVTATTGLQGGEPVVNLVLQPPADRTLARFTKAAQGKRLALLADERILIAPTVTGPITGGKLQIGGGFTAEDTERLADLITDG
jgi:preprotein translocase subunit SecD